MFNLFIYLFCTVLAFPIRGKRQWMKTCQEIVKKPPATILSGNEFSFVIFKSEVLKDFYFYIFKPQLNNLSKSTG